MQKSGLLFTALYLKKSSSSLQKAYDQDPVTGLLPFPVSLTREGYPRIIPSFQKRIIQKGGDRADRLVQLSLYWFSLSKVIRLAKPITKATFESITKEVVDQGPVMDIVSELKSKGQTLRRKYIPWVATIPISPGRKWEPPGRPVPNGRLPEDAKPKARAQRSDEILVLGYAILA